MEKEKDNGSEFCINVKNISLADPVTVMGRKAMKELDALMTEKSFFEGEKKVYVEPFSEYDRNRYENITKEDDPDIAHPNQLVYQDKVNLNNLKRIKSEFENRIKNLSHSLFIIKGVAGSGKTTYLHNLKREVLDHTIFHIHNLEDSTPTISFLSKPFDIDSELWKNNNVYKFISELLAEISEILKKKKVHSSEDDHRGFIKKIINEYRANINVTEDYLPGTDFAETKHDVPEQREVFDILERYAKSKEEYSAFSERLTNLFKNKVSTNKNETDILSYLACFLIRLFFCLSKIDKKKHVLVVDNIETFIRFDESHHQTDSELQKIVSSCHEATRDVRRALIPLQKVGAQKKEAYQFFYGILLVMRDTTRSMIKVSSPQDEDFGAEDEVDISDWFCTADIYNNKRNFFKQCLKSPPEGCYWNAYSNILNDITISRWCMSGIVSNMYKHEHRRITECVSNALAQMPKADIEYFNEMWETAKVNKDDILKSLCRKYVLHVLMKYLQRSNYFDDLMVENLESNALEIDERKLGNRDEIIRNRSSRQENSESHSYARKITTSLHRMHLNNPNEYVSFPRLINTILKPPYVPGPSEPQIEDLSKILFLMNKTELETNWTSLVYIKFDKSIKYTKKNLCQMMKGEWRKYSDGDVKIDNTDRFGIRITRAGSFLAKILPEFEYFACRFLSAEPPLLSKENFEKFGPDSDRTFRAVAIIDTVRQKAFACIDEIIANDIKFFRSLQRTTMPNYRSLLYETNYSWIYRDRERERGKSHVDRIINQHVGYITHYLLYVTASPWNGIGIDNEKEHFLELIRRQINLYNEKLQELEKLASPEYYDHRSNG